MFLGVIFSSFSIIWSLDRLFESKGSSKLRGLLIEPTGSLPIVCILKSPCRLV
nr:MAG TPA: hypothetical protein [Caudoviricetes sp.]